MLVARLLAVEDILASEFVLHGTRVIPLADGDDLIMIRDDLFGLLVVLDKNYVQVPIVLDPGYVIGSIHLLSLRSRLDSRVAVRRGRHVLIRFRGVVLSRLLSLLVRLRGGLLMFEFFPDFNDFFVIVISQ